MSDSSLQAAATRLIKKNGRLVTLLRKYTDTPSDPAKPWRGTVGQALSCEVYSVWTDPLKSTQDYQFAQRVDPHTTLRRQDWDVLIPAAGLSFVPEQGDYIRDTDSREYRIVTLAPVKPGGTAMYYTLQVQG